MYNFRRNLFREIQARGGAVVAAGAAGDGFEAKIQALGVPFVPLPIDKSGINPRADVILLWTLYRWYRRERPDIVHHFTIKPVIYGSLAAQMAGVPRVINTVTGLGHVFMAKERVWLRRLVELMYRLALRCADLTFFQNREDQELFVERHLVARSKARMVAGSGVDLEYFQPSGGRQADSGTGCRFLLMARLLREKGVYEFVEAARLAKQEYPETRFELLGSRDERNPTVVPLADIEKWSEEGVVNWLGETQDVRPFVAEADVVVLPSYREGTPRALLEAAAMEKPVIATDVAGCREVVEHGINGLLVPAKNPRELEAAMVAMREDPALRARMGKAGRVKVEREFSEAIVLQNILKAYTEVAV